jgi:hypothetical protein
MEGCQILQIIINSLNMKNKIFIYILLFSTISIFGQSKKYIGLNFAGSYGLTGLSFDSRFSEYSKFGYGIGISYGLEKNIGVSHWYFTPVKAYFPEDNRLCNYFSIPANFHYLLGSKKHFLETALGISFFVTDYSFGNDNRIGYFSFGRIAYRYESDIRPLLFSIGIDTPFRTPGSGLGYSFSISPSLTIGYKL